MKHILVFYIFLFSIIQFSAIQTKATTSLPSLLDGARVHEKNQEKPSFLKNAKFIKSYGLKGSVNPVNSVDSDENFKNAIFRFCGEELYGDEWNMLLAYDPDVSKLIEIGDCKNLRSVLGEFLLKLPRVERLNSEDMRILSFSEEMNLEEYQKITKEFEKIKRFYKNSNKDQKKIKVNYFDMRVGRRSSLKYLTGSALAFETYDILKKGGVFRPLYEMGYEYAGGSIFRSIVSKSFEVLTDVVSYVVNPESMNRILDPVASAIRIGVGTYAIPTGIDIFLNANVLEDGELVFDVGGKNLEENNSIFWKNKELSENPDKFLSLSSEEAVTLIKEDLRFRVIFVHFRSLYLADQFSKVRIQ